MGFIKVVAILLISLIIAFILIVVYATHLSNGNASCWEYRHICSNCFIENNSQVGYKITKCRLWEVRKDDNWIGWRSNATHPYEP